MSERHCRPNCTLATGYITPEAEEVVERLAADPSSELDSYALTTPVCPERACTLSLGDRFQLQNTLMNSGGADISSTAEMIKEWLPEDCPFRAGTGPFAEAPEQQDL